MTTTFDVRDQVVESDQFIQSRTEYVSTLVPNGVFPLPPNVPYSDYYDEGFSISGGIPGISNKDFSLIGLRNFHVNEEVVVYADQLIRFEWVTDPAINPQHSDLIQALKSDRFQLMELNVSNIYQSLFKTIAVVKINFDVLDRMVFGSVVLTENNLVSDIYRIINKINYVPILFSITLHNKYLENGIHLRGLISIVSEYVSNCTGIYVNNVTQTYFSLDDVNMSDIMLIPYNFGNQIYQSPEVAVSIMSKLSLKSLFGYTVLSSDPLVAYAISEYNKADLLKPDYFRISNNMMLISLEANDDVENIMEELSLMVGRYRGEKVVSLPSDVRLVLNPDPFLDLRKMEIFKELALMWRGEILFDNYPLIIKSHIEFSIPIEIWYQQSLDKIISGNLPTYRMYQHLYWGTQLYKESKSPQGYRVQSEGILYPDYDDNSWVSKQESYIQHYPKFLYAAVKSYSILIAKYPILAPYFSSPTVFKDLSIEAVFSDYDQVLDYYEILKGELYPNTNSVTFYSVINVDTFMDAVALRNFYQSNYPDVISFIVDPKIGHHVDNSLRYRVIINSDIDIGATTVPSDILKTYRDKLEHTLRTYYKLCNYPGQQENTQHMSLDQLLKLVPIYDPDTGYTACLPPSELDERSILFNPMTQMPHNDETISTYKNLVYGLHGYFTIGPLDGFLSKPPVRLQTWIDVGYPTISNVKNEITLDGLSFDFDEVSINIAFYKNDFLTEVRGRDNITNFKITAKNSNIWTQIRKHYGRKDRNNTLHLIQYPEQSSDEFLDGEDVGELQELLNLRLLPVDSIRFKDLIRSNPDLAKILKFSPDMLLDSNFDGKSSFVENTEMLGSLIENLWRCGFFLDDWALTIFNKTGKMSRSPYRIPPVIKQSSDGILDGYNALIYLKINEMILC